MVGFSPIEISKGMSGIACSKDKLPEIIQTVIGAVQAGEL
jgi:hypothetical protein